MNYYLYQPISYNIRARIKKSAKQMGITLTNTPWQSVWFQFLVKNIALDDLSTPIVIMENMWLKNPVCLIPESPQLITQLLETNFEGQVSALTPYRNLFSIAIPKTTRFNGQCIQGIFVGYLSNEYCKKLAKDFNSDNGTRLTFKRISDTDQQISICYKDPTGGGHIILNCDIEGLSHILTAKTIDEYMEFLGPAKSVFCYELDEVEQKTQFEVLRFVVAFMVYISAHEDAVKSIHDIKMQGVTKGEPKAMLHTMWHFKPDGLLRPHYRNLRDERYYRGEWAKWKRGSRWVPVNMETAKVLKQTK